MDFSSNDEEAVSIPLAPLIDIMFLFVCFFAVSQIHAQFDREMDLTLPTGQTSQAPQTLPGEIVVNVMKDGSYKMVGQVHSAAQIGAKLKRLAERFPGQSIIIRGDANARHASVVAIIDECRKADIYKIRIATLDPEGNP